MRLLCVSQLPVPGFAQGLQRFHQHAPLIRKIPVVLTKRDNAFFQAVHLSGLNNQLLPCLQHLIVLLERYEEANFPILQSILAPTIKAVDVHFGHFCSEAEVMCTLRILETASLPLEALVIHLPGGGEPRSPAIFGPLSQFIRDHDQLRHLSIWELFSWSPSLFVTASQLPHLVDLTLAGSFQQEAAVQAFGSPPTLGFPALRRLKMLFHVEPPSISAILNCMESPYLEELKLGMSLESGRGVGLGDVGRFEELRMFDLNWTVNGECPQWEDIAPLLACHNMEEFVLKGPHASLVFNDHRMQSAAKSWPKLRQLTLAETEEHGELEEMDDLIPPTLTIRGLSYLAMHCPSLKSLFVSVDARLSPRTSSETFDVVASSVNELVLNQSFVNERVDEIASFISKMYPNVKLDNKRGIYDPYLSDERIQKKWGFRLLWKQVWEKVGQNLRRAEYVEVAHEDHWCAGLSLACYRPLLTMSSELAEHT